MLDTQPARLQKRNVGEATDGLSRRYVREQQTPAALRAFQQAEIEKWWPIIKAANIKVE